MAFLRVMVAHAADPSRVDEILEYAQTVTYPALAKATGLRHWVSARDPESGKGFVVSVWDTREQAEMGLDAVIPGGSEKLASMGYVIDDRYVMDVVHEIMPQASGV